MSAPATQPGEPDLLFDWKPPKKRKLTVLGFFAISIGIHALAFCIFQVVYPPTLALLPPPARVSLIVPNSDENRTLLHWIEAEDPALASVTQPPSDSTVHSLPKLRHIPSFASAPPALKTLPAVAPDLRITDMETPGPVVIPHPQPPISVIAAPTVLQFSARSGNLEAARPPLHFQLASDEPPENARFLVAISPAGVLRYRFLQQSSGDAALDLQAAAALALCRFPELAKAKSVQANDAELFWASAEFQWGNDLARPPAPPEHAP